MKLRVWRNNQFSTFSPNLWDVTGLLIIFALFVLLALFAKQMATPYHLGEHIPISLKVSYLPAYTFRTILRLFIALMVSLVFTFAVGALAAKNKHAERIIIPLIDILQSIPVLGFLSITIVIFIALFKNSLLGPEFAAIFAIFTGQAWNMCLGFYQSLKTLPLDLQEAGGMFQLSAWQRFWRVEVPFAMPSLIWNMMMSLSGSWFFITISEAITVNNQEILLPGIGSYIAVAIRQMNKPAIIYAIVTMLIVILLYDQLLFRPLIDWSEKFRGEEAGEKGRSRSLIIKFLHKTRFLYYSGDFFALVFDAFVNCPLFHRRSKVTSMQTKKSSSMNIMVYIWYGTVALFSLAVLILLLRYISKTISFHEVLHVILLGVFTAIRIFVLIAICALIWLPIGVWVGMRPRVTHVVQPIAQFLAAFPANLLYPVVFIVILKYNLNVQIWTAPLMVLGTQWYILFNVIAGASALPKNLVQASQNLGLTGWLWWRRFIFPGVFPYFITGAITAAGGAWNASIVAEVVTWGHQKLVASGLGAYITEFTTKGDFPRVALGIGVMCLFVLIFNRLIWQPLYNLAEKRFQMGA